MVILVTILHNLVCLFLVIVVLLQSGKAADLAGAFGGMGSQTVFGPRGSATVLSKATTIAAAVFMVTSMTLSILATRSGGGSSTLLDKKNSIPLTQTPAAPPQPAPGQPAPGGSVPIQVTPSVNGQAGQTQTVNAPVVPTPSQEKQDKKQDQKK